MLVLSRKINQAIMVGDNVRIVIVAVERDQVKIGIEAPRDIPVHRSEVYEEIQRANRQAVEAAPAVTPASPAVTAPLSQSRPKRAKVPSEERRRDS